MGSRKDFRWQGSECEPLSLDHGTYIKDGNSEKDAHVWTKIGYLDQFKPFVESRAVANLKFISEN